MEGKLVETIYGKYNKFEITRKSNLVRNDSFWIYKDGSYWTHAATLADAVDKCR